MAAVDLQSPRCANEDLTAGLYSFRIVDQVEGCDDLFSLLNEFGLIPPGPYTFTLPGYGQSASIGHDDAAPARKPAGHGNALRGVRGHRAHGSRLHPGEY